LQCDKQIATSRWGTKFSFPIFCCAIGTKAPAIISAGIMEMADWFGIKCGDATTLLDTDKKFFIHTQ
jgi:hypothetical protein